MALILTGRLWRDKQTVLIKSITSGDRTKQVGELRKNPGEPLRLTAADHFGGHRIAAGVGF